MKLSRIVKNVVQDIPWEISVQKRFPTKNKNVKSIVYPPYDPRYPDFPVSGGPTQRMNLPENIEKLNSKALQLTQRSKTHHLKLHERLVEHLKSHSTLIVKNRPERVGALSRTQKSKINIKYLTHFEKSNFSHKVKLLNPKYGGIQNLGAEEYSSKGSPRSSLKQRHFQNFKSQVVNSKDQTAKVKSQNVQSSPEINSQTCKEPVENNAHELSKSKDNSKIEKEAQDKEENLDSSEQKSINSTKNDLPEEANAGGF